MSNEPQRNFDLNMNFNGMMPSTGGGGGQFPVTGIDGAPPFHLARIADMTKEVNSKSTGEIVKVKLEGVSQAVQGLTHLVTINIAHADPQVAKRGAQDMFALVYGSTGMMQIGNVSQIIGKNVGCTIRLDPGNKPDENYTRLDHFVFPDGRNLVINGQLQPYQAQAGNFNGGGNGGGFNNGGNNNGQGQQQNNQPQNNNPPQNNQGDGQSQGFNSGAQVQNNGGFSTGTMPNPNGNNPNPNNNGGGNQYNGAPNFNNGNNNNNNNNNNQGQGNRPDWSTGA